MGKEREDEYNRCDPAVCSPGGHTYGPGCAMPSPEVACYLCGKPDVRSVGAVEAHPACRASYEQGLHDGGTVLDEVVEWMRSVAFRCRVGGAEFGGKAFAQEAQWLEHYADLISKRAFADEAEPVGELA